MNYKKGLIIVVTVFFIGLAGYTVTSQNKDKLNNVENLVTSDVTKEKTTKYVRFTPQVLGETSNTKRVLFFYANWCFTCRPADNSFIQQSSLIPDGVTVIRVNYNDTDTDMDEKELAKKYEVSYQHTFVQIDENDNVVTRWNGGSLDKLLQSIN